MVAGSFSTCFCLSDEFLTHVIFFFYPNQLPRTFKISPLPIEIPSFTIGILEELPDLHPVRRQLQAITIGASLVGAPFSVGSGLEVTHSWAQSCLNSELL